MAAKRSATAILLSLLLPLVLSQTTVKRCLQAPDQQRLDMWAKANKPPIVIDGYDWNSGSVYNYVLKILAEEVLSYPVKFGPPNPNVYDWEGLVNGTVHVSLDVWLTSASRRQYITDYALSGNRKLETAGANGQNALSGWFVPQWAVDAYPAAASFRGFRDPNISRLFALNETIISRIPKPVFPQPSTNRTEWIPTDRALVLTILPSYANDPNPSLVRNLNLQASVQYAGSGDAYTAEIWRNLTLQGVPVIFSLWQPHEVFSEFIYRNDMRFKMIRLALPEFDERTCGSGTNLNCDFQSTFPQKVVSTRLQALSDEMYWLAKQIALTNEDINRMLGEISYRSSSLEDAACTWIKNNTNTWNQWIWFRKCDTGCGENGFCQFNQCVCKEGWEGAKCNVQKILRFVEFNSAVGIGILFVTVLFLFSVIALLALLVMKKNENVVKAQGFMFNVIILCSLIPAYTGPFFAAGSPSVPTCVLKIALPCISFVLIMSSLLVRNYRLIAIFNSKKKIENVTDGKLLLLMLPFLLVEVVLLILLGTIGKPSIGEMQDPSSGKWMMVCQYGSTGVITPLLIAYKAVIVGLAVILAYSTRDIPDRFGESKSIAMAIYNMAIVCASFIVVLFIVKVDETLWFIIYSMTVLLVGAVVEGIFFGRIVFYVFFRPGEDWSSDGSGGTRSSSQSQHRDREGSKSGFGASGFGASAVSASVRKPSKQVASMNTVTAPMLQQG
ncbi:hypothetical protein HDU96_008958 [Phlyctochytrium bullatum]|nr:hypothetical protein HDU96_008958 [Phlyctochytrium bullatum]